MKTFKDRRDAGRRLAKQLHLYRDRPNVVVLALPRGGVPVGFEVAEELHVPLDVLVVRKLGAPGQPELAMGAIAGGAVVINPDVYRYFEEDSALVDEITQRERREMQRRETAYRGRRQPLSLEGRIVILVDDGAATGASMRAAVQAARARGAEKVVVALPVCSEEAERIFRAEADDVKCIAVPSAFYAVGQWYQIFDQTGDDEVRELLAQASSS